MKLTIEERFCDNEENIQYTLKSLIDWVLDILAFLFLPVLFIYSPGNFVWRPILWFLAEKIGEKLV